MKNFKNKTKKVVTIFGASGFLGRYVVSLLVKNNFLIKAGVRNPYKARHLLVMGKMGQVTIHKCNVQNFNSVNNIIKQADVVINLVGILFEHKSQTFHKVHVDGSVNIAEACKSQYVKSLIYVSALAIDKSPKSLYAKTKLKAENSIKKIFKNTTIIRPSVIYGPEDNFTNKFAKMAAFSPFMPIINKGVTKFQPVSVLDVAKAIEKVVVNQNYQRVTYNIGGPEVYSFKEILDLIMKNIAKKRIYINLSFFNAKILALITFYFPNSPITLDQLKLLKVDNIVPPNSKGLKDLGIKPNSMHIECKKYLSRYKASY